MRDRSFYQISVELCIFKYAFLYADDKAEPRKIPCAHNEYITIFGDFPRQRSDMMNDEIFQCVASSSQIHIIPFKSV